MATKYYVHSSASNVSVTCDMFRKQLSDVQVFDLLLQLSNAKSEEHETLLTAHDKVPQLHVNH